MKKAKRIASQLCGRHCIMAYDCPVKDREVLFPELMGSNEICPLQKYEAWRTEEKPKGVLMPTHYASIGDLLSLCRRCEHQARPEDFDTPEAFEKWRNFCLDCPVQNAIDALSEMMAESAML